MIFFGLVIGLVETRCGRVYRYVRVIWGWLYNLFVGDEGL